MPGDDAAAMVQQDVSVRRAGEHARPVLRTSEGGRTRRRAYILLVEDDPAFAALVTAVLGQNGYRLWWASGAGVARRLLEAVRPDLVLLDLILPDGDGLLLCSEIRARWPTPIVVVSGTARHAERVVSLRAGADDFIAKPPDPAELLARVEAILRRVSPPRAGSAD